MRSLYILALLLLPGYFNAGPASAQEHENNDDQQWVEYRDGQLSVAFNETPVEVAVNAIRARTGLEIIVPSGAESKFLNLRLNRISLEPAVRSLLGSIGVQNFALMYDETGRPNRAVALEARQEARRGTNAGEGPKKSDGTAAPLNPQDHEKLQKQIEHWGDLQQEERARLEQQLKTLPPSKEREQLVGEYGRQVLGLKD